MPHLAFLFVIFFFLNSCARSSIRRDDPDLGQAPNIECIQSVLKTTQGIRFDKYETTESLKWVSSGNPNPPITHFFSYIILGKLRKYRATISLVDDNDGKYQYENSYSKLGRTILPVEKVEIPPVLEIVDQAIGSRCKIQMHSALRMYGE